MSIVEILSERGVCIPSPQSVEIGEEISVESIAPGVIIHAGSRIHGTQTSIGPKCVLGAEAPTTVEDCQLGAGVELKGGFYSGAVFLDKSNMGSCAHVRPGTILEEEASGAHSVGLKQTILLPFVTLGSLINFCDCLMAGGTSRKNHSEVGSSYIHFNYSPHQDKATASLIGDVARGVMLDQAPIFLGGQGGLVGPVKLGYGTTIAAGVVWRKDMMREQQLIVGDSRAKGTRTFVSGAYRTVGRIVVNNLSYIGNVVALRAWYKLVRSHLMGGDRFEQACLDGAIRQLDSVIKERIKRLKEVAEKMQRSLELSQSSPELALSEAQIAEQKAFAEKFSEMEAKLKSLCKGEGDGGACDEFLSRWYKVEKGLSYVEAIHGLSAETKALGSEWLGQIVGSVEAVGADVFNG